MGYLTKGWSYVYKVFQILYFVIVIGLIVLLSLLAMGVIIVEGYSEDARLVNTIAMFALLLTLPNIFFQLIQHVIPFKKEFAGTVSCPNCNASVEIFIKEK